MSTIAIVGDLHLGKGISIGKPGTGNSFNSRIADQIRLLNYVLSTCIQKDVQSIILTGDIFDNTKPDYKLVTFFINFLNDCCSHNISVHIIAGNHDLKRTGGHYSSVLDIISSANIPDVIVYKTTKTILMDGLGITLLPYKDRNYLGCLSNTEAIDKISSHLIYEQAAIPNNWDSILVGHLAIEGSIYFGGEYDDVSSELLCPLKMFEKYNYVFMGHIHTPQQFKSKAHVEHVGSLDISDFGEIDQKKNFIIFNSKSKIERINLPTRPLRKISIEVPEDKEPTKFVIDRINKNKDLDSSILRLDIKLPNEEMDNVNRKLIEETLIEKGVYHICNFSESRKVTVVPIDSSNIIDNTIGLKEAIKLYAEQCDDFLSDKDKERYIELSNSIVDRYGS
jgi:exonuclease SbcD